MNSLVILHISDLHRDSSHKVTNRSLLNSLELDRERYLSEDQPIPDPNLIIVSGDLIYGVSATATNAVSELEQQYQQAEEFLVELAKIFVDGDRERVVIVPGNHDVSYFHTMKSMNKLVIDLAADNERRKIGTYLQKIYTPSSKIRWSWDEFSFFEIEHHDLYDARMEAFCKFYERFYQGKRKYSIKPDEQLDFFDYPLHNVVIAAFSSCYGNDPISKQGAIHPDCVAEACLRLRSNEYQGRLLFAVWHHNTSGGPAQSDYIDPNVMQVLIEAGFSIGFHGHQHRPEFIEEKYHFGAGRKITIVSAGTLCAGPRELPTGQARSYNILCIDTEGSKAMLHQRRMQNDNFDHPIWMPGQFPLSNRSFVEFDIQKPPQRQRSKSSTLALGKAEQLIRDKRLAEAVKILEPLLGINPLTRPLLLNCYVELENYEAVVTTFNPPTTSSEIVYVMEAMWALGKNDLLQSVIESDLVRNSTDPAVAELRRKYEQRLKK